MNKQKDRSIWLGLAQHWIIFYAAELCVNKQEIDVWCVVCRTKTIGLGSGVSNGLWVG
jgi:hypothetical protein